MLSDLHRNCIENRRCQHTHTTFDGHRPTAIRPATNKGSLKGKACRTSKMHFHYKPKKSYKKPFFSFKKQFMKFETEKGKQNATLKISRNTKHHSLRFFNPHPQVLILHSLEVQSDVISQQREMFDIFPPNLKNL